LLIICCLNATTATTKTFSLGVVSGAHGSAGGGKLLLLPGNC
jgi:hypothetical protein